jgi:glycosyltransferase involved in cell wall biosynthesis
MIMAEAGVGVTIAIPNWNHELLLPRAILSAMRALALLEEAGVPGEVLVIDDFSRDGSVTLLRQLEALYHRSHFRYLAFGANAGVSASRNQALMHARYRFIAFLDADNELIPENLPILLETLEQTGAAAAYGTLLVRSAAATQARGFASNESMQGRLFLDSYVDAFSVFDRRQLLDVGGFEPTQPIREDFELWQHLATCGRRTVFVPVVLGYYYALPGSMGRDPEKWYDVSVRIRRIFNQVRVRPNMPMNTYHLRYHPAMGYL